MKNSGKSLESLYKTSNKKGFEQAEQIKQELFYERKYWLNQDWFILL